MQDMKNDLSSPKGGQLDVYLNPGIAAYGPTWSHTPDHEAVDATLLDVNLDAQLLAVFQHLDVLQRDNKI